MLLDDDQIPRKSSITAVTQKSFAMGPVLGSNDAFSFVCIAVRWYREMVLVCVALSWMRCMVMHGDAWCCLLDQGVEQESRSYKQAGGEWHPQHVHFTAHTPCASERA